MTLYDDYGIYSNDEQLISSLVNLPIILSIVEILQFALDGFAVKNTVPLSIIPSLVILLYKDEL
jgi:hypothetical protein